MKEEYIIYISAIPNRKPNSGGHWIASLLVPGTGQITLRNGKIDGGSLLTVQIYALGMVCEDIPDGSNITIVTDSSLMADGLSGILKTTPQLFGDALMKYAIRCRVFGQGISEELKPTEISVRMFFDNWESKVRKKFGSTIR